MVKLLFSAAALGIMSACALATPRVLISEESTIDFTVKEMGVPVSGKFKQFEAVVDIDPAMPQKSNANIRIEIGSLNTGNDDADAIAVGQDWLDKAKAPMAVFKSLSIRSIGTGHYEAKGSLSIKNRIREVVIPFNSADQANGKTLITSEFTIKRSEFGIGGGEWNEGGVVAEEVPVKVRLTFAPISSKTSMPAIR